jgi:4-hydroxyacetophenone monooxygenase
MRREVEDIPAQIRRNAETTNTASVPWESSISWSARLRETLGDANVPTLVLMLHHPTGDSGWISDPYRPCRGKPVDDNDSGGLFAPVQVEVRAVALDAVIAHREGRIEALGPSRGK